MIGICYFPFHACCFYFRFAVAINLLRKRAIIIAEGLEYEWLNLWPLQSACWAPNSASFVCELASPAHKDEQMAAYKAIIVTGTGLCVNIDLEYETVLLK